MLQKFLPLPILRSFVKEYWCLHIQHEAPTLNLPIAPIPETCLYFYPKGKLQVYYLDNTSATIPDNVVTGQTTLRHNLLIPNDYRMFKVLLQPSGFFRLFGIPMTLFTGGHEEMNLVLGNKINELREQIENADTFEEMVCYTDAFLLEKVRKYQVERHPIDAVLEQPDFYRFSLDELAHDACLSNRQFERKFLERTGVSPKFYSRVVRFNRAMKIKQQQPNRSWLHIAYDCGYFDHNHLLRDFKQFTGTVPTGFDFENAVIY
ncbi:helix-turn-helix domain-containing protein [Runella sp. MFBS21]|uniref:helix-turn-helix domain-containing protein n=1 Tax=Runella sp. MFBS21 TaxID=3034018 RepID=UPI0023F92E88|nr:helix-turn-helix domain-containing protein [Runella sp. MFBS21]MDF7817602.1 helix-turn-helix domain-containing protein [Runella sp. MFBS21]